MFELDQFCNEDQSTIAFYSKKNKVTVITSVYMPYDSEESPTSVILTNLTQLCENKGWDLIIGADANSHNVAWGSSDNNLRGEKLFDFIVTTELQICNAGNTPTFENAIRKEVIDITLTNNRATNRLTNWKVNREVSTSDHNRITYELNYDTAKRETTYRNVKKTDREKYKLTLKKELQNIGATSQT